MKKLRITFLILLLVPMLSCADGISDVFGSFSFILPDGYHLVSGDIEKRIYRSDDEESEFAVGALLTLEQCGLQQFFDQPETVKSIFDTIVSSFDFSETSIVKRVFVGDLPALLLIDSENCLAFAAVINRYDAIAIVFSGTDKALLESEFLSFIDNIHSEITPMKVN